MNFFKPISLVVLLVFIAVATSGCSLFGSKTPAAPKVITIWGFDDEDVWKPFVKDLSGTVKGYEIKYVKKTLNSSYENDSLNSILSAQGPDVWAVPNDWVYRHKDKLASMPDSLTKDLNLDEQFVPAVKESGVIDGRIYSLSPSVDTLMIFYNEKLIETALEEVNANNKIFSDVSKTNREIIAQPFDTWDHLVSKIRLVTKRSGNDIVRSGAAIGTSNNVSVSEKLLYALMLQNDVSMTSEKIDLATFNLPSSTAAGTTETPGKKALDFYKSFSDPNSPDYTWSSSMPNDVDAFLSGKTAMIFANKSLANYIAQKNPDFKYKTAPFPQVGTDYNKVIDFASFNTFVVPAISRYPDVAWQVVNLLSVSMADSYSRTIGISSSKKKKDFEPTIDRDSGSSLGSTQAQTAHTWVKGRYPEAVDSIFNDVINNVATQGQDTQTALDLAAAKVTELLRKESW